MDATFRIGAWSMLLLVLAAQLVLLAAALVGSARNRRANRMLAGALIVLAGMLTPFVLGYAGAYDAWPWLSFAPFAIPLAVGPFLYAYMVALTENRPVAGWHWFAPVAQFVQLAAVFPWPVATKTWFDGAVQEPYLSPVSSVAVLASVGGYAWAGTIVLRRYDQWLRARRRDPKPARRLRAPVAVLALLLIARAGYELRDRLVTPIDYFDLFGFYVGLGVAGLWLGLDGWRGAHAPVPTIVEVEPRDWAVIGQGWVDRLADAGWWRDPELDLGALARRLGTNGTQLSRGLNAAAGGFNAVLGRLRAEAVAARLDGGDDGDLLTLALDAGFGSKASFNRAFRDRFGETPSAYRKRGASDASFALRGAMRRVDA